MSLSLIPGVESSGSALDAERLRLNVIANNIANANTTRTADGQPYRRQIVLFESVLSDQMKGASNSGNAAVQPATVRVKGVVDDPRPFQQIYQPGHPHANAEGLVQVPNVNIAEEMVDMITASRAIEANVQVISSAKQMVRTAIDLVRM
jgi:flagellar basal-body rod protein FlgC